MSLEELEERLESSGSSLWNSGLNNQVKHSRLLRHLPHMGEAAVHETLTSGPPTTQDTCPNCVWL